MEVPYRSILKPITRCQARSQQRRALKKALQASPGTSTFRLKTAHHSAGSPPMRLLLIGLVIAGLTSPAIACINDIELPSHEREFRSQYRGPQTPPSAPSSQPTGPSNS